MNDLLTAILENNAGAVKRLLRESASLATALVRAETLYNTTIFHWLYVGDTALHLAAAGYRLEIVRLLIAAGADPNAARNRRRSTPLHYAADGCVTGPAWDAKRQVATIRRLIQKGAAVNAQDANGATPLHRAVRTRCAAAVRLLLESGGDPTLPNQPGSTPFHLAVQNTGRGGSGEKQAVSAQREIITAFLERGVSPELKSRDGKSVRDCARSEWIREMLPAL